MSLWDTGKKFVKYNPATALQYRAGDAVVKKVGKQFNSGGMPDMSAEAAAREASRKRQIGYINKMQGPQQTAGMTARIAALKDESKDRPLSQDAFFQGDRAALVSGAQQTVSGVENAQRATGTSGGFANQGSTQDAYDRLGSQLAQLGGQARQAREEKGQMAVDAEQGFQDQKQAFQNAKMQYLQAVEAGDAAAAQKAMDMARQIQAQEKASRRQLVGGIIGGAAQAGAAAASDERVKKEIKPAHKEIRSFLDSLGVHSYKYKDDEKPLRGKDRYVSAMAQELEKTEIGKSMVKDTKDGKVVDYGKGFGTMLAAQADLHQRLKQLEKKKG